MGTLKVNENKKLSLLDVFRKESSHIALAVDGGGIRGTMVAKALAMLEAKLKSTTGADGKPILAKEESLNKKIRLFAGTSTGSIIAAALTVGMGADDLLKKYENLGDIIFDLKYVESPLSKSVYDEFQRTFPPDESKYKSKISTDTIKKIVKLVLDPPIYTSDTLGRELAKAFSSAFYGKGETKDILMSQLWSKDPQIDLIITVMDLMTYGSRFVKPYNVPDTNNDEEDSKDHTHNFTRMKLHEAVLASSAVPLYFPMLQWDGCDFADGGIGAYGNPSYLAAYEIEFRLGKEEFWTERKLTLPKPIWDPLKTTLISIGTGKPIPAVKRMGESDGLKFKSIEMILNSFSQSTNRQQRNIVTTHFPQIDFRRYNIDFGDTRLQEKFGFEKNIEMDDKDAIGLLTLLGDELYQKMVTDKEEE